MSGCLRQHRHDCIQYFWASKVNLLYADLFICRQQWRTLCKCWHQQQAITVTAGCHRIGRRWYTSQRRSSLFPGHVTCQCNGHTCLEAVAEMSSFLSLANITTAAKVTASVIPPTVNVTQCGCSDADWVICEVYHRLMAQTPVTLAGCVYRPACLWHTHKTLWLWLMTVL